MKERKRCEGRGKWDMSSVRDDDGVEVELLCCECANIVGDESFGIVVYSHKCGRLRCSF